MTGDFTMKSGDFHRFSMWIWIISRNWPEGPLLWRSGSFDPWESAVFQIKIADFFDGEVLTDPHICSPRIFWIFWIVFQLHFFKTCWIPQWKNIGTIGILGIPVDIWIPVTSCDILVTSSKQWWNQPHQVYTWTKAGYLQKNIQKIKSNHWCFVTIALSTVQ